MAVKSRKKKRITLPKLEKRLWSLFSIAVRVKGADKDGYCTCVTCKNKVYYYGGGCHAGHFRPRTKKSVKFDFLNVNPQCATCNTYNDGEQFLYGVWLDETYGKGTAMELTLKGNMTTKELGIDMREHIKEVEEKCVEILHKHGLRLVEWQDQVSKAMLKRIQEWTAK